MGSAVSNAESNPEDCEVFQTLENDLRNGTDSSFPVRMRCGNLVALLRDVSSDHFNLEWAATLLSTRDENVLPREARLWFRLTIIMANGAIESGEYELDDFTGLNDLLRDVFVTSRTDGGECGMGFELATQEQCRAYFDRVLRLEDDLQKTIEGKRTATREEDRDAVESGGEKTDDVTKNFYNIFSRHL